MNNFNWEEFRKGKIAVWCDTEEKAREFVAECFKREINCIDKLKDINWHHNKENTCCYCYESENMKFKVGDKVVKSSGDRWCDGDEYKTITKRLKLYGENCYELNNNNDARWFDGEIELYKEHQTEFTFEEIHSFKDNKTYENINMADNVKTVRVTESGAIRITYANKNNTDLIIYSNCKFKLKENKRRLRICLIEHTWNGRRYEFREKEGCEVDTGDFVVCDTKYGRTYGKCISTYTTVETESKIKEYKECWRV